MLAHTKPAIHQYQIVALSVTPLEPSVKTIFFLVDIKSKMLPGTEKLKLLVPLQQSELAEHSSFKAITIATRILISNI